MRRLWRNHPPVLPGAGVTSWQALPLTLQLCAISALLMLVPAAHAYSLGQPRLGQPFFQSALALLLLTALIAIALLGRPQSGRRDHLRAMIGAYLVLPPLMAVPFAAAGPAGSFSQAWFEMLSSFTTTGATLYDTPGRLPPTLHLWRALAGWFGGFFVLVMAVAVLMPMNLGGMEVLTPRVGSDARKRAAQIDTVADPRERVTRFSLVLLPPYIAFTLVIWLGLVVAGETGLNGLCLAMAVISTSGILPDGLQGVTQSGITGEILLAVALCLGVTRRAYPGALFDDRNLKLARDPEVRLALAVVAGVSAVLLLRHWVGAIENRDGFDVFAFFDVLWSTAFTVLSFLTTTGLTAGEWRSAQIWSGLESHGLILLGLAMIGGGVATTAGGVKLLRVYALYRHGRREMERMLHPHSVGGGGPLSRQLRSDGAHMAWVFFMLFALSMAVVTGALTLTGLGFDQALILATAALTTTGQLATVAGEVPVRYAELAETPRLILGAAMVLGRIEALALLALLAPDQWRR